jgi:DNA-binding MarR family transcriptional regulator
MSGVSRPSIRRGTPKRKTAPARVVELGALGDHLGFVLRRAQVQVFGMFIAALKRVDLKPGQFAVLMVINDNPGLQQSDVCNALGIQKANFVTMLKTLERRGLVARDVHRSDRRARALSLTTAGRTLLTRACALQRDYERELQRHLGSADRARLIELLYKLLEFT